MDAWIQKSLTTCGIQQAGDVEHLRERPWAAIARVATGEGPVYFKADPPSESFEPALTQWLAQRRPDVIPSVVRIEAKQRWLLTRDAGAPLRDHIADPPDSAVWHELLPLYAELQIELCAEVDDLLGLGVPDSRPEELAHVYGELLSRWPAATAPSQEQLEALVGGLGGTIPASLAHEEFGDHNILLRDGAPVLIDWAESAVAHPFCGLVNTFRGLTSRWGLEPGSPELTRLRDAYLEPFTRFARSHELVDLFELAYPLGMVCRALTWDRLVADLAGPDRVEYEGFVPAWLGMAVETLEGKARLGS